MTGGGTILHSSRDQSFQPYRAQERQLYCKRQYFVVAKNREQPLLSDFDFDTGKILSSFRSISTLTLNTQNYLETPKWLRTLRNGGPKGPPLQLAGAVVPGP